MCDALGGRQLERIGSRLDFAGGVAVPERDRSTRTIVGTPTADEAVHSGDAGRADNSTRSGTGNDNRIDAEADAFAFVGRRGCYAPSTFTEERCCLVAASSHSAAAAARVADAAAKQQIHTAFRAGAVSASDEHAGTDTSGFVRTAEQSEFDVEGLVAVDAGICSHAAVSADHRFGAAGGHSDCGGAGRRGDAPHVRVGRLRRRAGE